MRAYILILSACSALAVSGCESANFNKYNPFRHYSDAKGSSDLYLYEGTRKAIALPDFSAPLKAPISHATTISGTAQAVDMGNSSVEIFDLVDNVGFGAAPMGQAPTMPSFNNGVFSSDSSVTIFSLDGPAPMLGGGFGGGMNNQAGYVPAPYNSTGYSGGNGANQIFFKHGSSRLGGGDLSKLSTVADQAKFAPVSRITVAGHASQPTQAGSQTVQGHILNLKESMNRAYAVSKSLIRKGVPAEKIKTVSWGATKPTGNDGQDRRVDIIMGEQ